MTSLKWTAPNDKMCIALRHPATQQWAICPSSSESKEYAPWTQYIKAQHETIVKHWNLGSYTWRHDKWADLRQDINVYKHNGFVVMYGSMEDLKAAGTKWLRDDPTLWWYLHTASVEQLHTVKNLGLQGSQLILESFWRHNKFEHDHKCGLRTHKGPSIVIQRWKTIFPEEFKILELINQMGLTQKDAHYMLPQIHNSEAPSPTELPSILF